MDDADKYPSIGYVVDTAHVPALRQAAAVLTRGLTPARPEQVETMVAKLSIAFPRQGISDDEAEVRLDQYVEGLDDIPLDILTLAYRQSIKTRKFFPTVSEFRTLCTGFAERKWRLSRINAMLIAHDRSRGQPVIAPPPTQRVRQRPKGEGNTTTAGEAMRRVIDQHRA